MKNKRSLITLLSLVKRVGVLQLQAVAELLTPFDIFGKFFLLNTKCCLEMFVHFKNNWIMIVISYIFHVGL